MKFSAEGRARRLPSARGFPPAEEARGGFLPPAVGGEREGRKQIATFALPRRCPRSGGGTVLLAGKGWRCRSAPQARPGPGGAEGRAPPPISAGQKNVQSKQARKAAWLQGWFHFRERISRLCKKGERRRKRGKKKNPCGCPLPFTNIVVTYRWLLCFLMQITQRLQTLWK